MDARNSTFSKPDLSGLADERLHQNPRQNQNCTPNRRRAPFIGRRQIERAELTYAARRGRLVREARGRDHREAAMIESRWRPMSFSPLVGARGCPDVRKLYYAESLEIARVMLTLTA